VQNLISQYLIPRISYSEFKTVVVDGISGRPCNSAFVVPYAHSLRSVMIAESEGEFSKGAVITCGR
jgi:hypothetical protein